MGASLLLAERGDLSPAFIGIAVLAYRFCRLAGVYTGSVGLRFNTFIEEGIFMFTTLLQGEVSLFFAVVLIALVFVLYLRGGVIFNKLFRGGAIEQGKQQAQWGATVHTSLSPQEVTNYIASRLDDIGRQTPRLVPALRIDSVDEEGILIIFGTALMESWRIAVINNELAPGDTLVMGFMGDQVLTVDGVSPTLRQMAALQLRIEGILRQLGSEFPSSTNS